MPIFLSWMLKCLLTILGCLILFLACAQETDSAVQKIDTSRLRPVRSRIIAPPASVILPDSLVKDSVFPSFRMDTLVLATVGPSGWQRPASRFENHPYFRFTNPGRYTISVRQWSGKEAAFYALIALLIFFAIIRNGFNRYISDLMKTFSEPRSGSGRSRTNCFKALYHHFCSISFSC